MAVQYERIGAAAVLTIDRPERRNAVDGATAALLHEGYLRFVADDGARVLVVTGAGGKAFCAGADLKAMSNPGRWRRKGRWASRGCSRRNRRSRPSRDGPSRAGWRSPAGATCASPARARRSVPGAALGRAADRRRHAAAAAHRRAGARARPDPHRAHGRRARGAGDRAGAARRAGRHGARCGAGAWRRRSRRSRRSASSPTGSRCTRGWGSRWPRGCASRRRRGAAVVRGGAGRGAAVRIGRGAARRAGYGLNAPHAQAGAPAPHRFVPRSSSLCRLA